MVLHTYKRLLSFSARRFCSNKPVRVRFAPSPTGSLHLGGLRTALYNYLFAKLHNGRFILRIEDTDQTRLVEGAIQELQNDLLWAGFEIDEGPNFGGNYGPYLQSERLKIYKNKVKTLLDNKTAYYCFCTDRRLNLLRKEALRLCQIPKYDNKCRGLSFEEVENKLQRGEPHCIRFKLKQGNEVFDDLIYGKITYDVALNEGDPVIMKSDGYPTYHFANVVDDHLMEISHVLRGVEWQISTTKHLLMYRAFNWEPPAYGHLPLLLNPDGTKLSKRQGDIKVAHYREKGIFPLALINFISHCGGGFTKDLEKGFKPKIYTLSELTEQFQLDNINVHSGKLAPERLLEFNRLELKRQLQDENNLNDFTEKLMEFIKKKYYKDSESSNLDSQYVKSIIQWSINRVNCLEDLIENKFAFLWVFPTNNSNITDQELDIIRTIKRTLETEEINSDFLKPFLKSTAETFNIPFSKLMKLLRGILSGLKEGPGVVEMIEILGKENTLKRLNNFIKNKENC